MKCMLLVFIIISIVVVVKREHSDIPSFLFMVHTQLQVLPIEELQSNKMFAHQF